MTEEGKQPAEEGEQQEAVLEQEEATTTEAAASGDDTPKPRIKKPVKPDDEEYKAQMTTLQEQASAVALGAALCAQIACSSTGVCVERGGAPPSLGAC